jgi:hypothetical protein
MTFENNANAMSTPATLTPEVQQAVSFLGALIRVRTGGDSTAGSLAVLEHQAEQGYASPVHRYLADDETFFVHGLVVTSPQALYLSVHTPAGFDRFTLAVGTPATGTAPMPPDEVPPDPAALAAMASSYGIEIVGPPPTP